MSGKIQQFIDTVGDSLGTSQFSKEQKFWNVIVNGSIDRDLYNANKEFLIKNRECYETKVSQLHKDMEDACLTHDENKYVALYDDMRQLGNSLQVTLGTVKNMMRNSM